MELEALGHYGSLATYFAGLGAIFLAVLGRKAGLVLAAVDIAVASGLRMYELLGGQAVSGELALGLVRATLSPFGFPVVQVVLTAALVAVGFGFEPALRRFGISAYRLDRNVMMGAAIGMVVTLFATPGFASGLTMMVLGAFLGALAGGLFSGVMLKRALFDALGAMLGLFGGDGIRLMCTISIVALVFRTWAG